MLTLNLYLERATDLTPGPLYDDPETIALVGCWRGLPKRLSEITDNAGFQNHWYDEVITDGNGRVHHLDQFPPTYITHEGEIYTRDETDPETLCEILVNNYRNADVWNTDFSTLGFELIHEPEYAAGWYHRHDDPEAILAAYPDHEVIFTITSSHMFETRFKIWIRPYAAD